MLNSEKPKRKVPNFQKRKSKWDDIAIIKTRCPLDCSPSNYNYYEKHCTLCGHLLTEELEGYLPQSYFNKIEREHKEELAKEKAKKMATEIVLRTTHNMRLEDQAVAYERLEKAIHERTEQIMHELPKSLWD